MINFIEPLIVHQPAAVVEHCSGPALRPLLVRLSSELRLSDGVPTEEMVALCELHPWLLGQLVAEGCAGRLVASVSPLANACACVVLYQHLPECEQVAVTSDEGREVLLRAAVEGRIRLRGGIEDLAGLIQDPNRLVRYGFQKLAQKCLEEQPTSPLSGYYHWWFDPSAKPVAPAGLSEEYLYRAALRVRGLGGTPDLRGINSACWAYHCLRDGLAAHDQAATKLLLGALYQSAAWTAQYCTVANFAPEVAAAHMEQTRSDRFEAHLLEPWLGEFVREAITRS
ncbi:hypothetical protein DB347_17950 [Opitutaceae bacterium EW11]|nr:hypothetical protein DB347_17950 [Opitutaceae bacterium EW11]